MHNHRHRCSAYFVLGGDGTFLSAVRWIGDQQTPIIGVKFGEVGFLAETTEDRLCEAAEAILDRPVHHPAADAPAGSGSAGRRGDRPGVGL
jgi:NAD kinase